MSLSVPWQGRSEEIFNVPESFDYRKDWAGSKSSYCPLILPRETHYYVLGVHMCVCWGVFMRLMPFLKNRLLFRTVLDLEKN